MSISGIEQMRIDRNRESKETIIVGLVVVCFFIGVVWLLSWATWHKEIPLYEYKHIEKWSKTCPEIRGMVLDATADGFIDNSEYRQIENEVDEIIKQQSIRNMNSGE